MKITKEKAEKVYDILVELGSADKNDKDNFIYNHTKYACNEWRFCGKLGFGGKYRSEYNKVTCYPEDETSQRKELINKINERLSQIQNYIQ